MEISYGNTLHVNATSYKNRTQTKAFCNKIYRKC